MLKGSRIRIDIPVPWSSTHLTLTATGLVALLVAIILGFLAFRLLAG